ncbi:MAG: xanthine dehydrogenase family protein subunit M [Alphaproteobacteria bacterium]|nr:xanthine dehydrogenase family protein subunit M [Alphaproteobacteria bacterium]
MTLLHKPATAAEAVRLLAADPDARPLAGGATLVAMMNADLARPSALVALRHVASLATISRAADGTSRIGAMRRHRETVHESDLRGAQRIVALAAARIANPTVRNMGTIGGSIAFADPAADYPAALVAADAVVEIVGPQGTRELTAEAFFVDWYATALRPGEIVAAVRLPPGPLGAVARYDKLVRVTGDFAIASVAVVAVVRDGAFAALRLAVGGCGPRPVRVAEAEALLVGARPGSPRIAEAAAALGAACDPVDDVRASAAYRRRVVPRMVAHALGTLLAPEARAA